MRVKSEFLRGPGSSVKESRNESLAFLGRDPPMELSLKLERRLNRSKRKIMKKKLISEFAIKAVN